MINGGNSALDALHPIHKHHEAIRSAQMVYTGSYRHKGKRVNTYENPELPVGAAIEYDPKTKKIEYGVVGKNTRGYTGKQARSLGSNLVKAEEAEEAERNR